MIAAAGLLLAACGARPEPEASAGLARCEAGLSARACKCAFDAMPTGRWQVFAAWAATRKGESDSAVWDDPTLRAALMAGAETDAERDAAGRDLVFLKSTCGAPASQQAQLSSAG